MHTVAIKAAVSNRVKSVGLRASRGCGRSQILSWSFYDWSLISSCPQGLLKAYRKADVLIPTTNDAGRLPASQLKSPFQDYSESLSKHLLRRHNPADTSGHFLASADTSSYQFCTSSYQSCTSDRLPTPVITFLHQHKPVLHQRSPIQRIPVLYHISRPAPTTIIRHAFSVYDSP